MLSKHFQSQGLQDNEGEDKVLLDIADLINLIDGKLPGWAISSVLVLLEF